MKHLDSILSRMNHDVNATKQVINTVVEKRTIIDMVQPDQYVGEIVNLAYEKAKVQINDAYRKKVGGVPAQCFLIATRINENDNADEGFFEEEDCSIILLRVMDSANLPGDVDKERILVENAELAHGSDEHWDRALQDPGTKKMMSFGAVQCRVLGTFYMEKNDKNDYQLMFGNDLSNFYPNRGLKVYKPSSKALAMITNFGINNKNSVKLGQVRYSSTHRKNQGVAEVEVVIDPRDLIAQKTAVFGMTRTGKSNTVKMIAKSIYQLRQKSNRRIGQLIFDANGEYANENVQDMSDTTGKAQALRNVWEMKVNGEMGAPDDVVTYGLMKNAKDPDRVVMKINFYDDSLLQTGKELIDDKLQSDAINNVQYIKSFLSVYFEDFKDLPHNEASREKRRRLVYKTLLANSGFKAPDNAIAKPDSLFNESLIKYLEIGIKDFEELSESRQRELTKYKDQYSDCATILRKYMKEGASYTELGRAFEALYIFSTDPDSTYHEFERGYTATSSSSESSWLDVSLSSLLHMFIQKNACKKLTKAAVYHDPKSAKKDYAQMIYEDLELGKLVIIDQALGDSELNKLAAERILHRIFDENSRQFSDALTPSNIIIYVEEAHNLMPRGSEEDTTNIWARVAKEGAKFNIGMIYSTQEVSSIQKNILKNTTNWFISHLNNKEEIRALSDFYDFADFASSILQAEDKGFIRMKTKSNKFVVPIQVDKFQLED